MECEVEPKPPREVVVALRLIDDTERVGAAPRLVRAAGAAAAALGTFVGELAGFEVSRLTV